MSSTPEETPKTEKVEKPTDVLSVLLHYLHTRPANLKLFDVTLLSFVSFMILSVIVIGNNPDIINPSSDKKKKSEYAEFIQATKTKDQIDKILDKISSSSGASRVNIFQFHNGLFGIGKIPFFYYSLSYEKLKRGVSSEIANSQRIPISIDNRITDLVSNMCYSDNAIAPETSLGHYFKSRGTLVYFRCPIHDLDRRLIGFVELEYTEDKKLDVPVLLEELKFYTSNISGLLLNNVIK